MSLAPACAFEVRLDAFEGPLEVLLELARAQKVDLARISISALAEQYLAWLEEAKARRLALAAEYLVMAAWLAWLKSRLLLPAPSEARAQAEEAQEDLRARLARLEALHAAVGWLETRPRLGRERLARAAQDPLPDRVQPRWTATLGDLLAAGVRLATRRAGDRLTLAPTVPVTVEAMLARLRRALEDGQWHALVSFLPPELTRPDERRIALAVGLVAGLELARQGVIELDQAVPFAPIMVRKRA